LLIRVDTSDERAIYRQVADEIKGLIATGKLREGEALPPVRQLARDLGVNLNTIATAYRELQDEGLIVVRHGSGATVTSRTAKEREQDDLRKPLRTALTELVLAGLSLTEIMKIVTKELRELQR
jgi:GntR family transcriptional regulator